MTLTLSVISDIPIGPDTRYNAGTEALALFEGFATRVAADRPDWILDLGDRLTEETLERDHARLKALAGAFAALPSDALRGHLLGNHDVNPASVGILEQEALFGTSLSSRVEDLGQGWQMILWNPAVTLTAAGFPTLGADLDWLEQRLTAAREADRKVLLASHVPLDVGGMPGNYHFERVHKDLAYYPNGVEIRHVIEAAGVVKLAINGHAHWNNLRTIDGIHFVTIPSLVDRICTWPEPMAAHARITLTQDRIEIAVHGRDPRLYHLPVIANGRHWPNPDRGFAPVVPPLAG